MLFTVCPRYAAAEEFLKPDALDTAECVSSLVFDMRDPKKPETAVIRDSAGGASGGGGA